MTDLVIVMAIIENNTEETLEIGLKDVSLTKDSSSINDADIPEHLKHIYIACDNRDYKDGAKYPIKYWENFYTKLVDNC